MQALKAEAAKKIGLQVITQAAKETRPAAINPQTNFVVLFSIVIVPLFILAAFQFLIVFICCKDTTLFYSDKIFFNIFLFYFYLTIITIYIIYIYIIKKYLFFSLYTLYNTIFYIYYIYYYLYLYYIKYYIYTISL